MKPTLKIRTQEFNRTLREYMEYSRKSAAEVINQKSYSITLAWSRLIHKASKPAIRSELEGSGRHGAPLAAALINHFLTNGGKRAQRWSKLLQEPAGKGLRGKRMEQAVKKFIRIRAGTAAFLRSGALPAVAIFARAIGKSVGKNAQRALAKRNLGSAETAKPGTKPKSKFWHTAFAQDDTPPQGGVAYAETALADAIAQQTADMQVYIERKMQKDANKFKARR